MVSRESVLSVELFKIANFYIVDTPGFSQIDLNNYTKEEIKNSFIEIKNVKCAFKDCLHIKENGCEVKELVNKNVILKSRKYDLPKTLQLIDESNASLIHVDLMDGVYVSNKNYEIKELINNLKNTHKLLDIHLMVKEPLEDIKLLCNNLNIWAITFHLDATFNPLEIIEYIKSHNIKVGIAINPDEDIHILDKYLDKIDYVLIMSVIPGKGGQKFIPEVLNKIPYLYNKNILIGIDGGINDESIKYLKDYQIDNIISGSFICMSDNYNDQINKLKIYQNK